MLHEGEYTVGFSSGAGGLVADAAGIGGGTAAARGSGGGGGNERSSGAGSLLHAAMTKRSSHRILSG
jgi:hypothetical protein